MCIARIGDGESPHLLKWARPLAGAPEVWLASSLGIRPGFVAVVDPARRLLLRKTGSHGGAELVWLVALPRLGRWLRRIDADWPRAHYLTSHGALAWLAKGLWRLRAHMAVSAWGSEILATPARLTVHRWLIRLVLKANVLTTSDSQRMTTRMLELGATEVMTIPFGLEALPSAPRVKEPWPFFPNHALEPLYRPERVLALFAVVAARGRDTRLVVANDGSLAQSLRVEAVLLGLCVGSPAGEAQVAFVGRLDSVEHASWYACARWYQSLSECDSVALWVVEAMAHGCIPILSDLPANHELVQAGRDGLIIADAQAEVGALEAVPARDDADFRLLHARSVYGPRDTATLLEGLARTIEHDPRHAQPLRLRLVGQIGSCFAGTVARFRQEHPGVVECLPYVQHHRALAEMMAADVLLLVVGAGDARCDGEVVAGTLPGKIFEYLRAARPMLLLGNPQGDAAQLLRRHGRGWVADETKPEQIALALQQMMQAPRSAEAAPPSVAKFERRALAG